MSVGRLLGGVLAVNTIYVAVGYCLLSFALRGRGVRSAASYVGLALLFGVGSCGLLLSIAAVAGARTGLATFGLVAGVLGGFGLLAGRLAGVRARPAPVAPSRPQGAWADVVATTSCAALTALLCFAVVGGFRSSPWLDDVWRFWVPKGLVLGSHGLVASLWTGSRGFQFANPDYPLWWSTVTGTALRFVGGIDLRAVNAQLAILVVAFVAALGRLLWGHVRPWVLWTGLLLAAAMPELFRQAQGGDADVPLAIYLALFCLTAVLWLLGGETFSLLAAFVCAAVALQIKSEGAPQLLVLAAIVSLLGFRGGLRRVLWLWGSIGGALVLATPWFEWRLSHGVHGDFTLSHAFDLSYLSSRTGRIGPSVAALRHNLLSPREWLVAVPLVVVLALLVALRERSMLWLVVPLLVGADFLFWVWVNWSDPLELGYRLSNSAYRVVDTAVLVSVAFAPLLAERAFHRDRSCDGS